MAQCCIRRTFALCNTLGPGLCVTAIAGLVTGRYSARKQQSNEMRFVRAENVTEEVSHSIPRTGLRTLQGGPWVDKTGPRDTVNGQEERLYLYGRTENGKRERNCQLGIGEHGCTLDVIAGISWDTATTHGACVMEQEITSCDA